MSLIEEAKFCTLTAAISNNVREKLTYNDIVTAMASSIWLGFGCSNVMGMDNDTTTT